MSSRLNRIWLLPLLLLASQVWALGLGEIRLSSTLNQPMYAEIELLSVTPDEFNNLTIQLASADTFARYELDRPLFLTRLQFEVVESGQTDGNLIRVTSTEPISEPFITFFVEASWSRGRLLRKYELEPAPQNSGQNLRPADFDTTPGGSVVIQGDDTLWGIASRVRPDFRLTMNQTVLAIYAANPQAFAGNINAMRTGASLSIPSADDVYLMSRGQALSEVQRQNATWSSDPGIAADVSPSIPEPDAQPGLTLVPPDDDLGLTDAQLDTSREDLLDDAVSDPAIDPVDARSDEIQAILEDQDSRIEIPDNELANLRGAALPLDAADDILTDDGADETPVDDTTDDVAAAVPVVVTSSRPQEKGIVDTMQGYFDDVLVWIDALDVMGWIDVLQKGIVDTLQAYFEAVLVWIDALQEKGIVNTMQAYFENVVAWLGELDIFVLTGGLLVVVLGILVWLMRRAGNRDEDESPVVAKTEPTADWIDNDLMVDRLDTLAIEPLGDTIDTSAPVMEVAADPDADSSSQSIEDNFSSETVINLDQSDPVAEADSHMACGLYDEAADLISGALNAEPEREDLLAKSCEIYFAWGNRDAFVAAAGRLKGVVGGNDNTDWDKTVIMGQQIAGDHEMFSGVSAESVSWAVKLSFDGGMEDADEFGINFVGGPDSRQDDEPGVTLGDIETVVASHDSDDDGGEFDSAKTEALPKDVFSADMSTDETGSTDLDRDEATVEQAEIDPNAATSVTQSLASEDLSGDLHAARAMTEVGTKLDLARAYVDMGDRSGARNILGEVLDEGDEAQKQQAQQLLDAFPA